MEDNKDVDELYKELRETLDKESEEEKPQVASDQNSTEGKTPEQAVEPEDENTELSEEDISKLSPRAQKRIREQAAKIKELAEAQPEKSPEADPDEVDQHPQDFKTVEEFLAAVQDEQSRNLLKTFYSVIKGEINTTLSPIEHKNNETLFETEFAKYSENVEGLNDYKNDLKKTFLRNPKQSIKALIAEQALDLQTSKIKPLDTTPSAPSRNQADTSNLSKDELYDVLETMRP